MFILSKQRRIQTNQNTSVSRVASQHSQTAYVGLQKSLHQELAFVRRITPYIGMAFQVVEDAFQDIFLPDLFQGDTAQIPGRLITGLPVKQARIAIPNPTCTVGENWAVSCMITGHLVVALRGMAEFSSGDHSLLMG